MTTQAERIAALETRMAAIEATQNRIEGKLDDLLAIRYKGAGAFWLASMLFGTSLIGVMTYFISWLKG